MESNHAVIVHGPGWRVPTPIEERTNVKKTAIPENGGFKLDALVRLS